MYTGVNNRTVIIADDEPKIRKGLRAIINRDAPGFSVAGEAADGRRALELIQTHAPDVSILDVKMPGLDGLEVVKAIKAQNLPTVPLILSGYDDYAFVRDALTHGAIDYILKPVGAAELVRALVEIDSNLTEREHRQAELSTLRTRAEDGIAVARNRLWTTILEEGESGSVVYGEEAVRLGIPVRARFSIGVVVFFGEDGFELGGGSELDGVADRILLLTEETLGEQVLAANDGAILTLLFCEDAQLSGHDRSSDIATILEDAARRQCTSGFSAARVGLSDPFYWLPRAAEVRPEAVHRAECAFYRRIGEAVRDDDCVLGSRGAVSVDTTVERLLEGIEIGSPELAGEAADELVDLIARHRLPPSEAAKTLDRTQLKATMSVPELSSYALSPVPRSHISHSADAFTTTVRGMAEQCARRTADPTHRRIRAAEHYIERHFRENLSRETVAESVNLSPNYFSTVFKEHTGKTFGRYLTQVRVETACRLLIHGSDPVVEIARRVGYEEPVSFHRAFRRVMGLSPQQFRRQHA